MTNWSAFLFFIKSIFKKVEPTNPPYPVNYFISKKQDYPELII